MNLNELTQSFSVLYLPEHIRGHHREDCLRDQPRGHVLQHAPQDLDLAHGITSKKPHKTKHIKLKQYPFIESHLKTPSFYAKTISFSPGALRGPAREKRIFCPFFNN